LEELLCLAFLSLFISDHFIAERETIQISLLSLARSVLIPLASQSFVLLILFMLASASKSNLLTIPAEIRNYIFVIVLFDLPGIGAPRPASQLIAIGGPLLNDTLKCFLAYFTAQITSNPTPTKLKGGINTSKSK
jgi:hypothetical protein